MGIPFETYGDFKPYFQQSMTFQMLLVKPMAYVQLIPPSLFLPIALTFTLLALFFVGWLIFFVEKSARELSRKDLIVGLIVRLLAFSITAGIATQFWLLVDIL